MTSLDALQAFGDLVSQGYIPSVGSWVQVAPGQNLTTVMNVFNTLGPQSLEIFFLDQRGDMAGPRLSVRVASNATLRMDLRDVIPLGYLPFEGSVWVWGKGDTDEGDIGLQAIDLDFIDLGRPEGHAMGSVHLIFDFLDTLSMPPFLDLVCARVMVDRTPEGAPRYTNYLGIAHVPLGQGDASGSQIQLSLVNENGERLEASSPIVLPGLGSWFGSLETVFPTMPEFLTQGRGGRGYGALNVREATGRTSGLTSMIKVVDNVSGAMVVDHLTDRHFARPAMKEPD